MKPLATITTSDPVDLVDLLKCITDLYIGVDGRQVTVEYGLTGLHVLVEEPVEYVDITERIALHVAVSPPAPFTRPTEPTTVTTYDDEVEFVEDATSANVPQPAPNVPQRPEPAPHPQPKDPFTAKSPAADPDGAHECLACDDRFRTTRAVSDHVRAAHWDDVIASYADNGAPGIINDWGIATSTAYRWAALITGDTAA